MNPDDAAPLHVDYLVIGAGAMGMAFIDTILAETDATVALVDRHGRPGGHWNWAYPFVRLHQPSAFYGVNSHELSSGRKDTDGGNAGLHELATGAEVLAYFDDVLQQQLATGRLTYLPSCEYVEPGTIVSSSTGARHVVRARKIVDATYSQVSVPSMRPPAFAVADGVRCIPPNDVPTSAPSAHGYVVIGAGKTGVDTCLWLLDAGVDPADVRWIMPRDSWFLDRANIQPVAEFFESTAGGFALQMEASDLATSIEDLFERLERTGQLLRLDDTVTPTMYRCATVTRSELDQLRTIPHVVRMGRVRSLGRDTITLEKESIPTSPDVIHVDCTADGLARRPGVPVFQGDRITLQSVRTCQQVFSAALIGHVEASYAEEAHMNSLCTVIPHPDSDVDWLRTTLVNTEAMTRWGEDRGMTRWLRHSRLNSVKLGLTGPPTDEQIAILTTAVQHTAGAIDNLHRLLLGSSGDPAIEAV